jgi:hypothetical protein
MNTALYTLYATCLLCAEFRATTQLGVGELFGMPNFVLGSDDVEASYCLRAASPFVSASVAASYAHDHYPYSLIILQLGKSAIVYDDIDYALQIRVLSIEGSSVQPTSCPG